MQEYLIVTGDRYSWIQFTPADLAQAITTAKTLFAEEFPASVVLTLANSSSNSSSYNSKAMFLSGVSNLFLGECNVYVCDITVICT